MDSTIAALATAPGEAGIGVVRISGPEAWKVADSVFFPVRQDLWESRISHRMLLGALKDGDTRLDQVLCVYMKGPASYTGEDVVEIHSHGGMLIQQKIMDLLTARGVEPALPGEFTRRAFLNGKLDLIQAESILDVIEATSERGLTLAAAQLEGELSREIEDVHEGLLQLIAHTEALLDFPEDELDTLPEKQIRLMAGQYLDSLRSLTASFRQGRLAREGIRMVLAGRPNVGKSSLLNALLRENRAIVTDIPGTTRDTIEEKLNLDGLLLRVVDTAGIRDTRDPVEKMGVDRSRQAVEQADVVLLLLDATAGFTLEDSRIEQDLTEAGKNYFRVWNKGDLADNPEGFREGDLVVSARRDIRFDTISREIRARVHLDTTLSSARTVTRLRHHQLLTLAADHLDSFLAGFSAGMPLDFLSIDLRSAWEALGEVLGRNVTEDIFDRIFSEFCVGK